MVCSPRAFFETDKGSQEFAYIPDDLLMLIESRKDNEPPVETEALGRPASPGEKGREILADDSILDDATTMLAMFRTGQGPDSRQLRPLTTYRSYLSTGKLIKKNTIQAEAVKKFLEASRVRRPENVAGCMDGKRLIQ